MLGAKVYGYALSPISKPNFFDGLNLRKYLKREFRDNIQNKNKLNRVINTIKPNIIFHLAAQSSVLQSYQTPEDTIKTNLIGTYNILESARITKSVKSMIIVTTDKVYLNLEKRKNLKNLII